MTPELEKAFASNKEKWQEAVDLAKSKGDNDTAKLGLAILNVVGVAEGWMKDATTSLGLLSVERAVMEVTLAIERGMGGH